MWWNKIKFFCWRHRWDIFWAVVIFAVAALPRLLDLGIFLTADEKNWMERGYEFVRAFKDFRFNDMLQTTHPGVTVLWLTGIVIYATMFLKHTLFTSENLPAFIYSAQFAVALLNTLLIPGIYLLLQRLFKNRALSVTAALMIALNPWLIGYSRVVHIDGVVTGFLLLAALSLLIWAKEGYSRRWLIFSAFLTAAAILSKAPAVFLLPYFWLVVLVFGPPTPRLRRASFGFWKSRGTDFTLFLLIVVLLFIGAWPAMIWVPDKTGNALVLKRDYVVAATTPHDISESFSTNLWHYPATLITRTEPLVLVLSIVFVGWLLWAVWRGKKDRVGWLLVAYVFFFVVMMTLGAKKGDRYVLPIAPGLDILAVLAVAAFARGRKFILVTGVLILISVGTVMYYHPYTLAYSNPFLPDNLSQELGWGEGLEQVGKWLNQQEGTFRVAAWYPDELGYFTRAPVLHINAHEQLSVRYIVLYHNMFGRPVEHPANNFIDEYYKKWQPVYVAKVVGKEYAWVYEKPVFDRVAGELVLPELLQQEITIQYPKFSGIDLMIATYSGRAKSGDLVVDLSNASSGETIASWRVPVSSLDDKGWLRLLDSSRMAHAGDKLYVDIWAEGTSLGNAPTVRAGKTGLAIRQLFVVDGEIANEYETKLLEQSAALK